MPPRLPDHQRTAILDDIRTGGTCRGIARKHGVAPATVANIARENGLTEAFERSQTKNATEAREADHRAARAELATQALDAARAMMRRGLNPKGGHDAQAWAVAFGIYVDKHLVLDRADSDDGADAARSMLARLGDALTEAAGAPPPTETDSGSR